MAKKVKPKASKPAAKKKTTTATIERVTEVRKTSIPPKVIAAATSRAVTWDAIARRAYEIYASGHGGSAEENWLRAEGELRANR